MPISSKIGVIELGSDLIRLAVVKTGGKRPHILDAVEAPVTRADDQEAREAQIDAVKKAVGELRHKPVVYTLCVSGGMSIVRPITVPFKGRRKVASAVAFELEPHLAVPIDEIVVDHLIVDESGGETEVLVVGLRREDLEEQLALLRDAGLAVEGVGLDAIGVTALWQAAHGAKNGVNAVLHVRPSEATLAVVNNGRLAYLQRVPSRATEFQSDPRSAARDVQNILRSYAARHQDAAPVESLHVTGSRLREAGRTLFEGELDMPVAYHDLAESVSGLPDEVLQTGADDDAARDDANRWSALIGCATAAAGGSFALNFQRPELGDMQPAGALMSHLLVCGMLAFMCILTYMGATYLRYVDNMREAEKVGQAVWNEFTGAFPELAQGRARPENDRGGTQSYRVMGDAINTYIQQQESFSTDMYEYPNLLEILREIGLTMPDSIVTIRLVSIPMPRPSRDEIRPPLLINITGEINASNQYQKMLADIEASEIFDIVPGKQERINVGGTETFSLSLRTRT